MSTGRHRVVFVTNVFDNIQNGPGVYAQYLWQEFRDDPEFDFHVVAPEIRQQHPRLHALSGYKGPLDMFRKLTACALDIAGELRRGTLVHGNATHGMAGFLDYPGPWVVQVNDYDLAAFWENAWGTLRRAGVRRLASLAWRRRQERKVLAAATRVICNSDFTRQQIAAAYGSAAHRSQTIYKAVDVDGFRRPDRLPPDPTPDLPRQGRLIFVGTNWQRKGLDVLLQALAQIARKVPAVNLTVVGPDDAYGNPRIKELCAELGLREQVFFAGSVARDRLPAYLWHSQVFVLPSRHEALGVAVLEAMAAKIPVVASKVGGIPEIIGDEQYGLLCGAEDAGQLARQVMVLLNDPVKRQELADHGAKRVDRFDVHHMTAAVRSLYRELLLAATTP